MLGEGFQQRPSTVLSTRCNVTTLCFTDVIMSTVQQCHLWQSVTAAFFFIVMLTFQFKGFYTFYTLTVKKHHSHHAKLSQSNEGSGYWRLMLTESWFWFVFLIFYSSLFVCGCVWVGGWVGGCGCVQVLLYI